MERKECPALLSIIRQMIDTSEPRRAEYFRGYRRGIKFHVLGKLEETVEDHDWLYSGFSDSGDHYLDAFARGYRHGCKGLKPEDN